MAIILAVNAGSSSVKISVYKADAAGQDPTQLAEAQVSGLTSPPAKFSYTRSGTGDGDGDDEVAKDDEIKDADIADQSAAFSYIVDKLTSDRSLSSKSSSKSDDDGSSGLRITHVVHRIVHGGDMGPGAHALDDGTLDRLGSLTELAPLHNGAALAIARAAGDEPRLRGARSLAVFDTSFHTASMPAAARAYAIDRDVARRRALRRYGFHGISYGFITRAVAEHLGTGGSGGDDGGSGGGAHPDVNLIALHLGSGASVCAIKAGRSIDTSMGLTPVSGLPGATRSGDVDPALVFHMVRGDVGQPSQSGDDKDEERQGSDKAECEGSAPELHITVAEELLNQKAGWKAMAGTTDFGEITSRRGSDERSALAFDLLVDRIVSYVGSYYFKLGGRVDALVFAGGIGEKSVELRKAVVEACAAAGGFEINEAKNKAGMQDKVQDIGADGSRHRILVVQTDEQWEMARIVSRDSKLMQ